MATMKSARHYYFFVGTSAELIRVSPIIRELRRRGIEPKLIVTGQTKVRIDEVQQFVGPIKPYIAFPEKTNKSSSFMFFLWAVRTFISALFRLRNEFAGLNKQNSYFVIFGDPVSTTIGAIIAKIYGLTVVHIESGDMTFNYIEPFPEEICRHINVRLADILFPPSKWAEDNLKYLNKPKYNTVYNTTADTLWWFMKQKYEPIRELKGKKYYVLILHRQEHILFRRNWSRDTLKRVIENADSRLTCVMFNHPLTISLIEELGYDVNDLEGKVKLLPMLSYTQFLHLVDDSEFLVTDGCSNQFEAYMMGKPCLLLRDVSEQIEGLGENVILYRSQHEIMHNFLKNYKQYITKPIIPTKSPAKIVVETLEKLR